MGIEVQLRRENREVLVEVGDRNGVLSKATSSAFADTRLLRYLVPWGDTVFNQAQANDLRDDVRQIIRSHGGTPLSDVLAEIEPLIERLSAETHVYLWFAGD